MLFILWATKVALFSPSREAANGRGDNCNQAQCIVKIKTLLAKNGVSAKDYYKRDTENSFLKLYPARMEERLIGTLCALFGPEKYLLAISGGYGSTHILLCIDSMIKGKIPALKIVSSVINRLNLPVVINTETDAREWLKKEFTHALKTKYIFGYSDITAWLLTANSFGQMSFHSQVASTNKELGPSNLNKDVSIKTLTEYLNFFENKPTLTYKLKVFNAQNLPKVIESTITGGNISLVLTHEFTKQQVDSQHKILFLEEAGETKEAFLNSLKIFVKTGAINKLTKCLFFGSINLQGQNWVEDVFNQILVPNKLEHIPIVYSNDFGHGHKNFILPLGAKTTIEFLNNEATITIKAEKATFCHERHNVANPIAFEKYTFNKKNLTKVSGEGDLTGQVICAHGGCIIDPKLLSNKKALAKYQVLYFSDDKRPAIEPGIRWLSAYSLAGSLKNSKALIFGAKDPQKMQWLAQKIKEWNFNYLYKKPIYVVIV